MTSVLAAPVRRRLTVAGVVQGVGFRPFVYRVATGLGLSGFVGNDSAAVFIEVQGSPDAVAAFVAALRTDAPPMAVVTGIVSTEVPVGTGTGFEIVASATTAAPPTSIPPDIAVCDDCVAELFDPADRRYRHPFITCTNCGPRFTIITALPYDRPATTMAGFPMCARCAAEYHDPLDRRFHAQPICCGDCGPQLTLNGRTGDVLSEAAALLRQGKVLAVKGIGGYHLACDAADDSAVAALRARKARGDKPFALLVADLEQARSYAHIDTEEAAVLAGPERPIVLLRRRDGVTLSGGVAPGSPWLGLMLPYTPVQHLLFAEFTGALVMTSANLSGEPLCYTAEDAAARLPQLCDAVLDHNRPIHVPCDDSVVRVLPDHGGREMPIRRSRGYAPLPVDLGCDGPAVLAVGGELKNTFCLTDSRRAFLSGHIGDMGSPATLAAFDRAVAQLSQLRADPVRIAADRHPGYQTRGWAERHAGDRPLDLVQHHHAHVVSLLAEHGLLGTPVVGVAFDGTGYGSDGTVWGGEILRLGRDSHRFTRAGHLAAVPMAGGDAAVRNPWRMALAHLWVAGIGWDADLPPIATATEAELRLLRSQFASGVGTVPCTSAGRLFDAVASLLGVRHRISYEGQAAIELEVAARGAKPAPLTMPVRDGILDPAPLFVDIVAALRAGAQSAALAAGFHRAVAVAVTEAVRQTAGPIRTVGLTGGVFQNLLLLNECRGLLTAAGFTVLVHRTVPPNDGGLALGQAAVSVLTGNATPSGNAGKEG